MSIINPYKPKLVLTELDTTVDPPTPVAGTETDVSCDIVDATPDVEVPTSTTKTFCQTVTIVGDPEESFELTVAVRDETSADWAPLLGKPIRVQLWDRQSDTDHRTFDSLLVVDPSLYGTTTPGEARTVTVPLPVLTPVKWAAGAYTPPAAAMAAGSSSSKSKAEAA
jgi:hypothetical protein